MPAGLMLRAWPLALVTIAISGVAAAEPRSFTHTYEYPTLAADATDVQLWHREVIADHGKETLEDDLAIGFGAADHFEADLLAQVIDDGTGLRFGSLRGETRVRVADRGELPIDIGIHAGVGKEFDARIYDLYARLVLARDFDRLTIAATGQVLVHRGTDGEGREYDAALGLTYELVPRFHLGLEGWAASDHDKASAGFGPALGFRASQQLWIAVMAGPAAYEDAWTLDGRIIIGFAR
jgi:hypothetical protein